MRGFDPRAFKKSKKAAVLGLGKSGLSCAKLLAKKGFSVMASDIKPLSELKNSLGRLPGKISLSGGGHGRGLKNCGFAVKSPGIKPDAPALLELKRAQVPVFSEMEVALAFSQSKNIAAVTGTNGKTTTVTLLQNIFKKAKRKAILCGNVGLPVSDVAPGAKKSDWLVIEASSYQLEDNQSFHPRISVLLNITPDHLDHHSSMEAYLRAKAKICADQTTSDFCVLNADDPAIVKFTRHSRAKKLSFGVNQAPGLSAWTQRGKIMLKTGKATAVAIAPPKLPGEHNVQNAMAAALAATAAGIKPGAIASAFKAFKGVEHRIEDAGTFKGVRCVNDSKATNVDSTMVALKSFAGLQNRILLILGGRDKGNPYRPLRALIEAHIKAILTIGESAEKIEHDLGDVKPIFPCKDLETAVKTAFQIGTPGDVLLLSPACASFDQFKDFEDRGTQFKSLVRRQE